MIDIKTLAEPQTENPEGELLSILEKLRHQELLPSWEEAYNSPEKVKCNCPMPHVQRSGSQALGLVLDIDLCCLAREVEKLTGKKFYYLTVTKPVFQWDTQAPAGYQCKYCGDKVPGAWSALVTHMYDKHNQGDNHHQVIPPVEGTMYKLGMPVRWMLKRMRQLGIPIKNEERRE